MPETYVGWGIEKFEIESHIGIVFCFMKWNGKRLFNLSLYFYNIGISVGRIVKGKQRR